MVYRRKKTFLWSLFASIILLLCFMVLTIVSILKHEYNTIWMFFFLFLFLGGIFLFAAISEYRSYLEIDSDKIVFHYMVFSKDKGLRGLNRKGLPIYWKDVSAIRANLVKGDHIQSADTVFVTFLLRDMRLFETTFFHFGKDMERDILSKIEDRMKTRLLFAGND